MGSPGYLGVLSSLKKAGTDFLTGFANSGLQTLGSLDNTSFGHWLNGIGVSPEEEKQRQDEYNTLISKTAPTTRSGKIGSGAEKLGEGILVGNPIAHGLEAVPKLASGAITGGAIGGLQALLHGGNPVSQTLLGGLTGGVGEKVSEMMPVTRPVLNIKEDPIARLNAYQKLIMPWVHYHGSASQGIRDALQDFGPNAGHFGVSPADNESKLIKDAASGLYKQAQLKIKTPTVRLIRGLESIENPSKYVHSPLESWTTMHPFPIGTGEGDYAIVSDVPKSLILASHQTAPGFMKDPNEEEYLVLGGKLNHEIPRVMVPGKFYNSDKFNYSDPLDKINQAVSDWKKGKK